MKHRNLNSEKKNQSWTVFDKTGQTQYTCMQNDGDWEAVERERKPRQNYRVVCHLVKKKSRNLAFSTQSGPFSWKNAKFHKVFISKNKLKKCQLAQAVYLVLIIHFLKVTPTWMRKTEKVK